jgi:hypothetical protein
MSSLVNLATRKSRRDTAGNWTSNNPTPLSGEWCYETDTGKAKIGDGSTAWTSLEYAINPNVSNLTGVVTGERYSTAWVSNSDWTANQFDITHSLSANLSEIDVKFLISTDGTDNNSFEVDQVVRIIDTGSATDLTAGFKILQIDDDNIRIQTGIDGIYTLNATGDNDLLQTNAYYYKVVVTKLTIN